ncbi:PhoX family protein [Georgenia alba]|uniref:PhoX family protein n=1 Tax=Georgenia alba TaxID=2233858 RepID=A0ABW2Q4J5_9MICO
MPPKPPARRTFLPLLPGHGGGRSALTCRYRCGNACFHEVPNRSGNPYFGDVAAAAFSRRSVLKAGLVLAATAGTSAALADRVLAATEPPPSGGPEGLVFEPIDQQTGDAFVVPDGYVPHIVIRWGDPLFSDAAEFDPANQTAEGQARQFGYNNDHVGLFELEDGQFLMVVNHEYTDETLMFPAYDAASPTEAQVATAWAAHGLSVVTLRGEDSGALTPVLDAPLNRRLTATTEFELTGPAAGSQHLQTSADPEGRTVLGTLNNCAGGLTPWGTWLTAEENFNQYFANSSAVTDPTAQERLVRYGATEGASERLWETFDPRFDLAQEPNEINRFGWIVEVDPFDPSSTPRKRTALGRFKHEAATINIAEDGRAVAYMGDDEVFDYLYKFVSDGVYVEGDDANNATLLDSGTLYVARFTGDSPAAEIDGVGTLPEDGEFDGSGEWIPLVSGTTSHVPGMSAEEVLIFTRQAGDAVGATRMDRPEDVEPSPATGRVYVACTNNTDRVEGEAEVDEANPRFDNKDGHVIEIVEENEDAGATAFAWRILLVCGSPDDPSTYFAGFDKSQVSTISCPDNLAFDPAGNLWISTDGQPDSVGWNDALYQVPLEGDLRGQVRQFLAVPTGAETCGPVVTEDRVIVAVQHPGEIDGASFESPASNWPDGGSSVPRPSVVVTAARAGEEPTEGPTEEPTDGPTEEPTEGPAPGDDSGDPNEPPSSLPETR